MPFEDDVGPIAPRGPLADPLRVAPQYSTSEVFGSAFRKISPVGSILNATAALVGIDNKPDPSLDVWNEIKDSRYAQFADAFVGVKNRAQLDMVRQRIDLEDRDNAVLAESGAAGVIAGLAAGIVDPTILLPGGAIYRSLKGGYSVGRTAGSAAAWGAVQGGASEMLVQGSQITRKPEEILTSVASSAILSGILGSGAAALLSKGERIAAERALDEARGMTAQESAAGRAMTDAAPAPGAGAATADLRENVLVGQSVIEKIPEAIKSPTLRTMGSMLSETRRITGDLVVLATQTMDNRKGVSAAFEGIPVEAEVMRLREQLTYSSLSEMDRLYREYRFGAEGGTLIERGVNAVQGVVGQDTGFLTKQEFRAEIAKAMRRGDQSEIPQVQAAAQKIRKDLIDPLVARAQAKGLLPEDLQVKGAESWFMRMYNRDMIEANGPAFVDRIESWLKQQEVEKEGIRAQLDNLNAQRAMIMDQVGRLEARAATVENRLAQTEVRLAERGMEARAAAGRADVTAKRVQTVDDQITEIRDFIAAMRQELNDPTILARLDQMEAEARELRKAAGPYSDAEIRAVTADIRKATLDGEGARIADLVTGRQKPKAGRSFLSVFFDDGIYDPDGEVRRILGAAVQREPIPGLSRSDKKDAIRPGLLRAERNRNSLDDWGEKLASQYPEVFPTRPTPAELLEMMDEAARGRNPAGWDELTGAESDRGLVAYANDLQREFDAAGIPAPKNRDEFVAALNRLTGDPPALIAAINRKLEATGRADNVARALNDLTGERKEARGLMREALGDAQALGRDRVPLGAAAQEAGIAARRNTGRMGVLEQRLSLEQEKQDFLAAVRADLKRQADDLQARIEDQILAWQGNSSAEARAALKSRQKYQDEQRAAGKEPGAGGRLTMADDAVDRAVKRILGRQGMDDLELRSRAEEIKDRIIGTPDGRLPYDIANPRASGFVETDPMQRTNPRGSLATRDFAIPDELIEDFLVNDAEEMVHRFLGSFLPDVALAEKFSNVDLTAEIKQITEEGNRLERLAKTEKERAAIRNQVNQDIEDVKGFRDRIRNTFGASFNQNFRGIARAANVARIYNQVTLLGGAGLSSLPDMAGVVFRYGLDAVTSNAWGPFLKSLVNDELKVARKAQKEQLRAMGIGIETWTAGRMRAFDSVNEAYRPNSRFERGLDAAGQGFFIANGQAWLTDASKHMAGSVAMHELVQMSRRVAENAATAKDTTMLAQGYINADMAKRIWAQFSQPGAGDIIDGITLPNLDRWTDAEARRTFEAAVMREVNIAVITPGQEKPFLLSNPVVGLIGQFKGFTAVANERLLVAQLQQADGRTLQGLVTILAAGALAVAAGNVAADRPLPERPQDWMKEAIEKSGVLGWLSEVNQLTAKATSGTVDMYRLIGADKPLSGRNASASAMSQLLGPTFGKVESVFKMTGAAFGEDGWDARATQEFRRLLPLQNLWALRRLLNEAEDGVNRAFGIEPLDRDRLTWQ